MLFICFATVYRQVFEYMEHDLTGLLEAGQLVNLTEKHLRQFMQHLMQVIQIWLLSLPIYLLNKSRFEYYYFSLVEILILLFPFLSLFRICKYKYTDS